ncbi:MAG: hypothetical protein IPL52_08755 [Flavobacteriales bacterium]|nr:hypothetical protein [Flavobacteriales bacterium]
MRKSILLLSWMCCGALLRAQPGTLDASFSADGLVSTDIGASTFDRASAAVVQDDGRIVVVGTSGYDKMLDFGMARNLPDGTPDDSFSANGEAYYSMVPGNDLATSVAMQADGKILVGGYGQCTEGNCFGLMRLLADGSLDPDFGNGGIVTTEFSFALTTEAKAIAVQDDGKILLPGGGMAGFAVVRYLSDGQVDTDFGTDGLATCAFSQGNDRANAMALLADGRILLSGYSSGTVGDSIAVTRLLSDGSVDLSFGAGGRVRASLPNVNTIGQCMAVGPAGEIVVAGYYVPQFSVSPAAMVARFTSEGELDPTFYGTGLRDLAIAGSDASIINGVVVQPDGKPLLCGTLTTTAIDFLLMRLNADGSDDLSFNSTGTVTTDFTGTTDRANGIAMQTDGRIIVVGETNGGPEDYNFAVARYLNDIGLGLADGTQRDDAIDVFPVPAKDRLTLSHHLPIHDIITIEILDQRGAVVLSLMNQRAQPAGMMQYTFNLPEALSAGSYLLRLRGEHTISVAKLMVE